MLWDYFHWKWVFTYMKTLLKSPEIELGAHVTQPTMWVISRIQDGMAQSFSCGTFFILESPLLSASKPALVVLLSGWCVDHQVSLAGRSSCPRGAQIQGHTVMCLSTWSLPSESYLRKQMKTLYFNEKIYYITFHSFPPISVFLFVCFF